MKMVYKMIDRIRFKFMGLMKCIKCATKWKRALKQKGKRCRILPTKEGYEVYSA